MNNQILLLVMIILPWLSLFFLKKDDIKRFMSVALFSAITSILISEINETLKMFVVKETLYPLQTPTYLLGLNPVVTIWIFKFTDRKFWRFLGVEVVFNLGFAYIFLNYFLQSRGIIQIIKGGPIIPFAMTMIHGVILYVYQRWQEDIFKNT